MNKQEALDLMYQYAHYLNAHGEGDYYTQYLEEMPARFPEDGSEKKVMRWLGFMQGVLWALGLHSINELKEHSRNRSVPK